jgi:prophage regulatory protein
MDDDALLRWPELARVAKLSRSTVDRLEKIGQFPKRVKLGPRAVAWRRIDIESWLSKLGSDQRTEQESSQ